MTDTEVPLLIWTIVEINLSIVSACLPTLRPLFLRVRHGKMAKSISYPTRTTPKASKQSGGESELLETEAYDDIEMGEMPIAHEQSNSASNKFRGNPRVGLGV